MRQRINWIYYQNFICWLIVHITHWGLYFGNIIGIIFIVIYEPWYLVLPLLTILYNPVIGDIYCAYNNIENRYRSALGWPLIEHSFVFTAIEALKRFKQNKGK
jgi:hypothetical protein